MNEYPLCFRKGAGSSFRRCGRLVLLGTLTQDIQVCAIGVEFGVRSLCLTTRWESLTIPCLGEPPSWGEKGSSSEDLSSMAAHSGVRILKGGGLFHSTEQLARNRHVKAYGIGIHAVDTGTSSLELTPPSRDFSGFLTSLGLAPTPTNLIVTSGHLPPRRLVVRSTPQPPLPLNGQARVFDEVLCGGTLALLINSPRSDEAAACATATAKAHGVRIYTVLTPSLRLPFRLERLLSPNEVCVCNLSEFTEITRELGVPCPSAETPTSVAGVARALSLLSRFGIRADVAVTMGAVGCVFGDARTGLIAHVGLRRQAREIVWANLTPEKINGSGDRFAAELTAEHLFYTGLPADRSPMFHAVRFAAVEVLQGYSRSLRATPDWFDVRIFSERHAR
jgi:sugar/nucleoside kinase (ribokinase family)